MHTKTLCSFSVWSLDVWGNAEEGYEVNDRSRVGRINLHSDMDDNEIGKALEDAGFLKPGSTEEMGSIDGEFAHVMYLENDEDSCPWLQLENDGIAESVEE